MAVEISRFLVCVSTFLYFWYLYVHILNCYFIKYGVYRHLNKPHKQFLFHCTISLCDRGFFSPLRCKLESCEIRELDFQHFHPMAGKQALRVLCVPNQERCYDFLCASCCIYLEYTQELDRQTPTN